MKRDIQDSRVEFFHSQSSFHSSVELSSSRIQIFLEEINQQTQTIFCNLQTTLYPRQDLLKQQELKHIMHRAKLLANQTIPNHEKFFSESKNSLMISQVRKNKEKLSKLCEDESQYRKGDMSYPQFYDAYGRKHQKRFSKKNINLQEFIELTPEVVQIMQPKQRNMRAVKVPLSPLSYSENQQSKQIHELRSEIYRLKKKQKQKGQQYEETINKLKIESEERVKRLLEMFKASNFDLNPELTQAEQKLKKQIQTCEKSRKEIQELENQILQLRAENQSLRGQLQFCRRVNMDSSRSLEQFSAHSPRSEQNGSSSNKYQEKKIHNLIHERNLLRAELTRQRQNFYKLKKREQEEKEGELISVKKIIQQKNEQIKFLKKELDEKKVENIKLEDQYQGCMKLLKKVKSENGKIPSERHEIQERMSITTEKKIPPFKCNVKAYDEENVEGWPYYEILASEFQMRYRRACLKEKQLLHKSNGVEVGVITSYFDPNEIKIMVHLSNFGENQAVKNLKLKAVNSNENEIFCEKTFVECLNPGQQVKSPIYFEAKNYPLGASVLFVEYEYYEKKQILRLLLPVHIFKMMKFKPRDGEFRNQNNLKIVGQRKVVKDIEGYFKGAYIKRNKIECTAYHDETQTKILMEIEMKGSEIQIRYEHRGGEEKISEYFVKTLLFLLKRES